MNSPAPKNPGGAKIKKGVKKERYLSKEDALLLNQFLNKIKNELQETEN